jgi:hypothetical protein
MKFKTYGPQSKPARISGRPDPAAPAPLAGGIPPLAALRFELEEHYRRHEPAQRGHSLVQRPH